MSARTEGAERKRRQSPTGRLQRPRLSSTLPGSKILAERVRERASGGKLKWGSLFKMMEDLDSRLRDELTLHKLFAIEDANARYFDQKEPVFGIEVAEKFPSLAYDIEEAGRCLALERSTASVFHSIRSLEGGIRALSRCLRIPDPTRANDRSWGNALKSLNGQITSRWPGSSARLNGDGQFFDTAYAALAAMQNPWRNATMHLDQKYTQEEARHILEVVGGFMRRLSFRMDENGEPKVPLLASPSDEPQT